jgi:polyhydroxyalkanoate synthase subunit PhaC
MRYRRTTPALHPLPVLFCYALINRSYILDLQPDKSVVQRYLEQGYDVFMIDWGVPSPADRSLTLEDYVVRLLGGVVHHILREHGYDKLHLLGYCMGGTLAALFAALEPDAVQSLTLLAAPVDFDGREALLNIWAQSQYFDVDAFIDTNGNCPAWFLQLCFLYTKPVQNILEKNVGFYEQMEDPRFLTNFFAMERWVNDNIPVAGETFREFVKKLYQQNQLVRGELHIGARHVDLGRIECPLLLLTARNDHLVAPASTNAIAHHVSSVYVKQMMIDAGHVGLVVSGKAHKTFWPEAVRWLAEAHSVAADGSADDGHKN